MGLDLSSPEDLGTDRVAGSVRKTQTTPHGLPSRTERSPFASWLWNFHDWPLAVLLAGYFLFVRWTSRVEITGEGAKFHGPAVYVNWHRHLPFLIAFHGRRRRFIMVSRAPHMAPIARWCRLMGLELVRGATGEGGRRALAQMKTLLENGESVVLAVDGPTGPAFQVKPGCIDLARDAGVPIIPVGYRSRGGKTLTGRWDEMRVPVPFDDIVIVLGEPIVVGKNTTTDLLPHVGLALDTLDPGR